MKQGPGSADGIGVKSTIKEDNHPIQHSDREGEECQRSIEIEKDRINLPEGSQPMHRGTQRDGLGGLSFDSFWKCA